MRRPVPQARPVRKKLATPLPTWLLAVLLVLVAIALYWPATHCGFVNYDDDAYVLANVRVQNGLTWESVQWACGNPVSCNWHPLTVWSHMAVCQVCGLNPWGHHLANALLHGLNAGLVFALLQQMTGATWRSLLVAALFAFHPLRVESVAWVSERKDVLCGFFGLLALLAYVRYAQGVGRKFEARTPKPELRSPKPEARGRWSVVRGPWSVCSLPSSFFYLLSLFFFALGLMSKPMLVTWPFVMLLLDYWPLGRMQKAECGMPNAAGSDTQRTPRARQHVSGLTPQSQITYRKSQILFPLLLEKLPFFFLAAAVSVVTLLVQQRGGSLTMGERLSLGGRVGNALVSYGCHVAKLCWPTDLAVFYPHPGQWPLGQVMLAGGVILVITVLVVVSRRRRPYLLVGWLWFVGMLVPVIGLVQTGGQAMADRHTYLPSLGVLILAVWGASELVQGKAEGKRQKAEDRGQTTEDSDTHHAPRTTQHVSRARVQSQIANRKSQIPLGVAGGAAIILCLALTRQQIGYWQDGETLFRHALEVTENNDVAHTGLGVALGQKGQLDEAIRQFQEAIRLKPGHADPYNSLGAALGKQGHLEEAIRQFQEAIRRNPDHADAHDNLGAALYQKGQLDEAIRQLQDAIRLKPAHAEAHYNLGVALGSKGQADEAIVQYQEATRLKPGNADAQYNLGLALAAKGQTDEAIRRFAAALKVRPDYPEVHNHLGLALVRKGQVNEAIWQFQEALRLKPGYAGARKNLEAVLAARGQGSLSPRASLRP